MFRFILSLRDRLGSGLEDLGIEAGVTLIRPEDLDFPNTMTDIDYDTWMLSGSSVMRDGQTIRFVQEQVSRPTMSSTANL